MKNRKYFFWLPMVLLTIGCATRTPQTEEFLKSSRQIPETHQIQNVPFVLQEQGHCGPATLTMALNWWGKHVTIQQLVSQVYTPKAQGSFQTDMVTAARRNGMIAVPISGIEALATEVASNHPVIVFENLGLSWYPLWHYALVYGYDIPENKFILHSGKDQALRESFKVFENSWKLADYWGLVILPPNQLSVTANELEHLKAASALEQLGLLAEANESYEAILRRWPQSLGAWIGRANVAYTQRRYQEAVAFLKQATRFHPESKEAKHNLNVAEKALVN